jgi:hypothetical protein
MIQINLIHDQKIAKVAAPRSSGGGFKFALPRLPFNVGMVAAALLFIVVIVASIIAYGWQQTDFKITNKKIKTDSLKIDSLRVLNAKVQELIKKYGVDIVETPNFFAEGFVFSLLKKIKAHFP